MTLRRRARTAVALVLSIIAAISAVQTSSLFPSFVSADNTLSLQLTRSPTSTESASADGTVEINIQTGQVTLELKHATPSSMYEAVFVSVLSNIQLSTLSTGAESEGHLETTMSSGVYAGIFQLTKDAIVQFITAEASFTIGSTTSVSTTASSTETTIATTSSPTTSGQTDSNTAEIQFQVEPAFRSIRAGAFAKFNIRIMSSATANILLTARGVPSHAVAIFTPHFGTANPEFHSTLTIVTSDETMAGTYEVKVLAVVDGKEFESEVALEVTASTTTTSHTSSTVSILAGASLTIALDTDTHHYEPNATVSLHGHVTDDSGSAVADANVSVQVDGPTGSQVVFLSDIRTDSAGVFQVSLKLQADATAGTYTAYATTSRTGYASATTHTTFVVGSSSTPSVVIKEVYVTDIFSARSAVFSAGQTLLIWVVVENSGASFEGVIWVQVLDSNGTPILIQLQITKIDTGQTVKVAFGFVVQSNLSQGVFRANALVSDNLISLGGVFLASADAQFAITA